jgi:hypothetical protein
MGSHSPIHRLSPFDQYIVGYIWSFCKPYFSYNEKMSCERASGGIYPFRKMEISMSDAAAKPANDAKRPKQGRSPAYPAIAVKEAIEKAKALYDAQGKYPAPMSLAFDAWGYSAKSSGGRDIRAALKYFGLISLEGDGETGKVKLTDDALRILLDEREDQSEKKAIIRRVALNPVVHKKLLEQFPDGIKSDASVEHFLVFEEGFNKSAAGAVVAEFKATATYAELYKPAPDVVKSDPETVENDQTEEKIDSLGGHGGKVRQTPPLQGQVKVMAGERELTTGLLSKEANFRLLVSGPIGVKEIERLIAKLELDKEILGDASPVE